ncbi:hypothetical protein JW992_09775 [candidate division KSB1 bacterium]|nr:hypothetical protein [candidate division KSB1 bacterium]
MNLISDYRDQEDVGPTLEREDPFEEPKYESREPVAPHMNHTDFDFAPKRRRSSSPWLIIFALLILIGTAVYWGFLRDQVDFASIFSKKTPVIDAPATDVVTQQPSTVQPPTTDRPAEAVRPVKPSVGAESGALGRTARIVDMVFSALHEDVRLSTLIMDEHSFSVEIAAKTRATLEAFYSKLNDSFSGTLSFSPSNTGIEARALITGLFAEPAAGADVSMSADQVLQNLRRHAASTNVQVIEASLGTTRRDAGRTITPLFFKIRGTRESCRTYLDQIVQENGRLRVAKIILMSTTGQQADLVLRLEVVNAL